MTVGCPAPDGQVGIALRLSDFLGCEARALGENGFQALAGGPLVAGLLSGLVTIFVALIGYRFILGSMPSLRDGIGWAVRLGMVLTLATGWPAFQALVYRVATDTPDELAAALLPVAGLPAGGIDARVQQAYDAIRLGAAGQPVVKPQVPSSPADADGQTAGRAQNGQVVPPIAAYGPFGQPGRPQTATWFVVSTLGITGALRLAIGFLLAIGPIPIMALLFEATLGLFIGWLRALAGATLAALASLIVTALDLIMVESELAHLQTIERGVSILDPQALTTIVVAFTSVMLVALWAASRMAGALRFTFVQPALLSDAPRSVTIDKQGAAPSVPLRREAGPLPAVTGAAGRTQSVADALSGAVQREHRAAAFANDATPSDRRGVAIGSARDTAPPVTAGLGTIGRRSSVRRTRSAARRDGIS